MGATEHECCLMGRDFCCHRCSSLGGSPQARADSTMAYDGSELQYLGQFNTAEAGGFPYGVSPLALGYNYYKRAAAM